MRFDHIISFYGSRPFWQKIIAAIGYTGMFVCLYNAIVLPPRPDLPNNPGNIMTWIFIAYTCFMLGLYFSRVRDFHFDFVTERYKVVRRIGPFALGNWKQFKSIDYVSVFRREYGHYQVKVWFQQNKDLLVAGFYDFDDAMQFGKELAIQLQVDVLDAATNPRDSEWVDPKEPELKF